MCQLNEFFSHAGNEDVRNDGTVLRVSLCFDDTDISVFIQFGVTS